MHRRRRVGREVARPQDRDYPVGRDNPVGVHQEQRQERPPLGPSEVENAVVVNKLEGPEDQELHRGSVGVRLRSDSVTSSFDGCRAPLGRHLSGLRLWMEQRLHRRNSCSGVEESRVDMTS